MRIGIVVRCATCGNEKQPHGRSVSPLMVYCSPYSGCPGYEQDPKPGCLWPGETEDDFGFIICNNGVKLYEN